jgi:hypothetical protein
MFISQFPFGIKCNVLINKFSRMYHANHTLVLHLPYTLTICGTDVHTPWACQYTVRPTYYSSQFQFKIAPYENSEVSLATKMLSVLQEWQHLITHALQCSIITSLFKSKSTKTLTGTMWGLATPITHGWLHMIELAAGIDNGPRIKVPKRQQWLLALLVKNKMPHFL